MVYGLFYGLIICTAQLFGCFWWVPPFCCGVRQGTVLSPVLFSVYVNELIEYLKASGYGIYIGSILLDCISYADDIALLSCSCCGPQTMLDIRCEYGFGCAINFYALKTYTIASWTCNYFRNHCSWQHALRHAHVTWIRQVFRANFRVLLIVLCLYLVIIGTKWQLFTCWSQTVYRH